MVQTRAVGGHRRLNILILYDCSAVHINTVYDHLASFSYFSRHNIFYSPSTYQEELNFSLECFDVIIIHYSVRLAYDYHLAPAFRAGLSRFNGLKALFIQDEYEHTWHASQMINELGIRLVFTCVPPDHVRTIYARVQEGVEFVQVLTGYLPLEFHERPTLPLRERKIAIGYRGRELPWRFGNLSREKFLIGVKVKEHCEAAKIPCDIAWTEDKRIYGQGWLEFLGSCRATLAAESGSNVFDFDGTLDQRVAETFHAHPGITYEEFHQLCLHDLELDGVMNQISPRVFEAVAVRTALIMYEGTYSGVLEPHTHYLPLRKDHGNFDEIAAKLLDDTYVNALVERAYDHIMRSGKFTYEQFVRQIEGEFSHRVQSPLKGEMVSRVLACPTPSGDMHSFHTARVFNKPLTREEMRAVLNPPPPFPGKVPVEHWQNNAKPRFAVAYSPTVEESDFPITQWTWPATEQGERPTFVSNDRDATVPMPRWISSLPRKGEKNDHPLLHVAPLTISCDQSNDLRINLDVVVAGNAGPSNTVHLHDLCAIESLDADLFLNVKSPWICSYHMNHARTNRPWFLSLAKVRNLVRNFVGDRGKMA